MPLSARDSDTDSKELIQSCQYHNINKKTNNALPTNKHIERAYPNVVNITTTITTATTITPTKLKTTLQQLTNRFKIAPPTCVNITTTTTTITKPKTTQQRLTNRLKELIQCYQQNNNANNNNNNKTQNNVLATNKQIERAYPIVVNITTTTPTTPKTMHQRLTNRFKIAYPTLSASQQKGSNNALATNKQIFKISSKVVNSTRKQRVTN